MRQSDKDEDVRQREETKREGEESTWLGGGSYMYVGKNGGEKRRCSGSFKSFP